MLKSLKKIQSFGVFNNFSSSSELEDFNEKNIIYGWNYSGKTTFSRVFSTLEHRATHPDFPAGKFTFDLTDGTKLDEHNFKDNAPLVRVFNSEFIENNLSWDGESFNPILLLGEDTIEAEKKIEKLSISVERCRTGYKKKKNVDKEIEKLVSSLKTNTAKQIKNTLNIVEAYTATHLDKTIALLPKPISQSVLSDSEVTSKLKKALATDTDRLEKVQSISIQLGARGFFDKCNAKLKETPSFSSVIEYLRDNPAISDWIEKGLSINEGKTNCEFCGGKIEEKRIRDFKSHFSKDLARYKEELKSLMRHAEKLPKTYVHLNENQLYPEFRTNIEELNVRIESSIEEYNHQIERLINNLKAKHDAPFSEVGEILYSSGPEDLIRELLKRINDAIYRSNKATENFDDQKQVAIDELKKHYAATFLIDNEIDRKVAKRKILSNHKKKYRSIAENFKAEVQELQASISKAQKGREVLNEYISNFLGRDEIRIEVVEIDGYERFRLSREGSLAKNLSEGEKSAIAFSFFLTKLAELKELNQVIVYIDDPISSLDSNHIFQVNALIKDYFFGKFENQDGGSLQWQCKCKQIFISTHNFEFFSLLKELPLGNKKSAYFQVKRVSSKESKIVNLPKSIEMYSSEYHYLFSIIYRFHESEDKEDLELLLSIPNAVRRFVELYTYSRIPSFTRDTVDQRAEQLFGAQKSKRILKVLHYFSHLNNIERLANNSDLVCDIGNAVDDIMKHLQTDKAHYEALLSSVA
ncbi:AAA family ATPase [Microbulbifer yueqingensis]|uniref:Wobble nucleotide-excising tRNase n=1 Tax=Microbulbifer yueqingensis TaxID=658219 RepID=A0A1G9EKE6_9GAMM|nr:AAA family ATPase [Microbulbifer yueqingensis]SDK76543.1 Wobble nucleotide-excising tRNase [Microbulbifer yueqingensis]